MDSKTPKFDALIDKVLAELIPHTRTCPWASFHNHCEKEFEITAEDIEFLKLHRVPPPNFCPTCRRIKRFAHLGTLRLFKRLCNAPGHSEKIISILPENCPFPVYDYAYFISDEFNSFSFGVKYESDRSPLEQLFALRKKFPMPSFLNRDPSSVNSEYTNGGRNLKNGYYASSSFNSENIWYSAMIEKSRDVMDSKNIRHSDQVYGSFDSSHIYKSSFVYFSKDCTDSMFLFDCRNCDRCFGCVNLRNRKHCVWNKQLSKEDYEAFIKSLYPISRKSLAEYKSKLWELVKSLPVNAGRNVGENISGVMLNHTRNAHDVTDADNSEHIRHSDGCLSNKDSMDILISGGHSSMLYGTINVGSSASKVKFSVSSKFSTDSEFIFNSKNLSHCFMCFGLQNKSYCVFNTQYSPEEYFSLVDEIKSEMLKRGEYGDGIPIYFSALPYNFSIGQISFPLTDEEIVKLGGYVSKEPETNVGDLKVISAEEVPQTIEETTDDILNRAILCEVTGRPFRIIKSELDFYRQMKLPVPTVHPSVRLDALFRFAPIGKKYKTTCAKCGKTIESVFNPEDKFILYCEKDYQGEVV